MKNGRKILIPTNTIDVKKIHEQLKKAQLGPVIVHKLKIIFFYKHNY